ncbi:MAG: winged helix-turn-helix domain-containing protein [Acidobacteria bacterium]|nr:winged helix-turn-helix domain-containing protein [Acidobacteriota bacterium]
MRDGERVSLTPKAFDLLLALVEHHGHLLEKDELMKLVWPDAFVDENNLASNTSQLRKALGEGENGQKFIGFCNERWNSITTLPTPGACSPLCIPLLADLGCPLNARRRRMR